MKPSKKNLIPVKCLDPTPTIRGGSIYLAKPVNDYLYSIINDYGRKILVSKNRFKKHYKENL